MQIKNEEHPFHTRHNESDIKMFLKNFIKDKVAKGERPSKEQLSKYVPTIFAGMNLWLENLLELKYLHAFLLRQDIHEIMVFGPETIYIDTGSGVERGFDQEQNQNPLSEEEFNLSLELWSLKQRQFWNNSKPFVSFECNFSPRHDVNFRATLAHSSISKNFCHKLFLRRPLENLPSLSNLVLPGVLSILYPALLRKTNMVITGGTGSGKTTLLRAMAKEIQLEHVITLEDTAEIDSYPAHTNLLARENFEMSDLVPLALRMRPDRIWPGEIRSKEIVPLILALNTGHRGLVTTLHANSGPEALSRLSILFLLHSNIKDINANTVGELFIKNIDLVVHMENRRVSHIIRWIGGIKNLNASFEVLYGEIK